MKFKNTIIALVGGSGSGKSTVEGKLFDLEQSRYNRLISTTSRDPRDGEKDGEDYYFSSKKRMNKSANNFIELNEFNGNLYGVLESELVVDKANLLVIEPKGLRQIEQWAFNNKWDIVTIHLNIPEELRAEKMRERGDSEEQIERRLKDDNIDEDFKKSNSICDLEINEYLYYPEMVIHNFLTVYLLNKAKLDKILAVKDELISDEITLLVGKNSSGKSLLRSQLGHRFKKKGSLKSISMQMRTVANINGGALSTLMMDDPDVATSFSTLNLIDRLFESIGNETEYIVIDEPEIGMSKETIYSISHHLNNLISDMKKKYPHIGVLIITHSEIVLEEIIHNRFIDLSSDMTLKEYINRPIYPTNLNELRENTLFRFIQNRLNRRSKFI